MTKHELFESNDRIIDMSVEFVIGRLKESIETLSRLQQEKAETEDLVEKAYYVRKISELVSGSFGTHLAAQGMAERLAEMNWAIEDED